MDRIRGYDHEDDAGHDFGFEADEGVETPNAIGTDERRMHVRAYNYWVSLLDGRAYPSIEDLDPASIDDFGPNSVLLDFTRGIEDPAIVYLGRALREECGIDQSIQRISDVPPRSLLSRLTDHYLQIIANRAPIGFEAEFNGQNGRPTVYRGILMPFSSDDDSIDFIYGVINWKELVEEHVSAELAQQVDEAIRNAPAPVTPSPVWGENFDFDQFEPVNDLVDDDAAAPTNLSSLADWLAAARETAETVRQCDGRSRAALYEALGRAYDFALEAEQHPEDYAALLEDAGLTVQARAPMTPIVKLVFGADYDKTRLTEYAAALAHGRRQGLAEGALPSFLEGHPGGLKGVVAAERALRTPAPARDSGDAAREKLRALAPKAKVAIDAGDAEFVILVARRAADGSLDVLAPVADEALVDRAIRKAAR